MTWNPVVANVFRRLTRFHTTLYRLVGGRGLLAKNTLILTTRGRKTGREIGIPLLYVEDGGRLYIVASWGGSDTPPHWYLNLVANPEVGVEVAGRSARYRARSLSLEEAKPVWPKLLAIYPTYASYQQKTSRVIPVVELVPMQG